MDMRTMHQDALIFHLTGRIVDSAQGEGLKPLDQLELRPALLAAYRELSELRHDFPLVLDQRAGAAEFVQTLSSLVDTMLREVAPRGAEGERLRRHGLQLECAIRRAVDAGATGTLTELWDAAAARLGEREGDTLEQVLRHAGSALHTDGEVLGCSPTMPARLITHAWAAAQRAKAQRFHADLNRLVLKLSDILRAAYHHSQAGRRPQSLKDSVGAAHHDQFDFEALARIVGKGVPRDELPASRRERLVRTLDVLEAQAIFPAADAGTGANAEFVFENCASAALALRERLPELAELVKALAIAELEAQGRYVEAEHDLFFETFDQSSLTADDLARFPDALVCIPPERNDAPENANLMELLSSGLPVKVLVQTTDLLEEAALATGRFAFGVRSARLATTAMGLGGMFVLQSTSSNLYALRGRIAQGLACRGPALFSVYSGPADAPARLPPYLVAAAAMQSRAFPAFTYDAAAGSDWATRFSLENNPQADADWPIEQLDVADAALQRSAMRCAFKFADFVLCDPRYRAHFALAPSAHWSAAMLPAADWLALPEADAAQRIPYLLAVDADDTLHRIVVASRLMQAARRCLLLWRRLQEHGGVHDSHAQALLLREKAAWAAQQRALAPGAAPATAVSAAGSSAAGGAGTAAVPAGAEAHAHASAVTEAAAESTAPQHSRDEAWIETARCPSCNECNLINDRMFAYDERKQAYIKDIAAGTYRELVEAAESCQVAIIHPGAPRDPNEPGLDELLARAEPFR
jgi:hypothetical protein